MSTIFVSHSSLDNVDAVRIKGWLEERGHRSLFLDFDPDAGIEAGARWEATLFEQLRRCQVLLILLSENWLASKWCFAELVQARERGKPIIIARIGPCQGQLLPDLQHIDLSNKVPSEYRKLENALSEVFPWDDSRVPYPGLSAFQEEDAAIFFGREAEVIETLETLESLRLQRHSGARFLLVMGASGSGKSSIIRAGVLPRLRRAPERWQVLLPFHPRDKPLTELALAVALAQPEKDAPGWQKIRDGLIAAAAAKPPDGALLDDLIRDRLVAKGQPDACVLVVIDQMEELFSLSEAAEARHFLRLLRAALECSSGRLIVLTTMRSDFLGAFQTEGFLNDPAYAEPFLYNKLTIDPLPVSRFKDVILGPAQRTGLVIDADVADRLVSDTVTGDALPLLAFTLRRLWDRMQSSDERRFELQQYEQIGGLVGAIESAADEALTPAHRRPEEIEALHTAFVPGLVKVNSEGVRTRRLALRDRLPRQADRLLECFVDARLLVSDHNEKDSETLEVAHEALLRTWRQLDQWIDADRDKLRSLEGIRRAAAEWERNGRGDDLLVHRDGRLLDALTVCRELRFRSVIDDTESRYLDSCETMQLAREQAKKEEQEHRLRDAERIALEQREKVNAQRRVLRRTLIGSAGVLVFAIAALVAASMARNANREADMQRNKAVAQQLAAQGDLALQTGDKRQAEQGALVVIESLRREPGTLLGQQGLASVLTYFPPLAKELTYTKVNTSNSGAPLAFSPNGEYFAASGPDLVTRIWSIATGNLAVEIPHTDHIRAIAFSNDSKLIATAGRGSVVGLWRLPDGRPVAEFKAGGDLQAIAFGKQGKLLAAARDQGSSAIPIWDLKQEKPWKTLNHQTGDVIALQFGPNSRYLATAGYNIKIEENVTTIWDLKDQQRVARDNHLDSKAVAFSLDGQLFAAGGLEGRVEVWQLKLSNMPGDPSLTHVVIAETTMSASSLAFSPDGSLLAIADERLRLWDFRTNRDVAAFQHPNVRKVAFVANGRYLASASIDSMRLWDLARGPELRSKIRSSRQADPLEPLLKLLPEVCRRIGRELSLDEWSDYLPGGIPPAACVER